MSWTPPRMKWQKKVKMRSRYRFHPIKFLYSNVLLSTNNSDNQLWAMKDFWKCNVATCTLARFDIFGCTSWLHPCARLHVFCLYTNKALINFGMRTAGRQYRNDSTDTWKYKIQWKFENLALINHQFPVSTWPNPPGTLIYPTELPFLASSLSQLPFSARGLS